MGKRMVVVRLVASYFGRKHGCATLMARSVPPPMQLRVRQNLRRPALKKRFGPEHERSGRMTKTPSIFARLPRSQLPQPFLNGGTSDNTLRTSLQETPAWAEFSVRPCMHRTIASVRLGSESVGQCGGSMTGSNVFA